jgi:hypothetical protein
MPGDSPRKEGVAVRYRFVIGFALGLLLAMTAVPSALAIGRVSYYAGNVTMTSGDGTTAYGGTTSLVKRTVNRARHEITETVIEPAKKAGEPAVEIVTHLKARGKTSIFDVEDEGRTFRGTMTFSGNDWKRTHWTYEIEMLENGAPTGVTLSGDGDISPTSIRTRKVIADADGNSMMLVEEDLGRVTPAEFRRLKSEMEAP